MFVRWKKTGPHSFAAVLVECKRVGGKPRQKIIKYLATIRDADIEGRGLSRYRKSFWSEIERRLDMLNLPVEVRAKLASEVARRVPQWTPEDEMRLPADNKAYYAAHFPEWA